MMKFLVTVIITFVLAANLFAQDTIQKKITVLTPSDGAIWKPGTTETVEWTSNDLNSNVHIKLSTDGGNTFTIMLQENVPGDGPQSVLVPDIASTQCVIKVEAIDSDKTYGLSSGNFTISAEPLITVITPGVDSKWIAGTEESVAWISENLDGNVNIILSTDGGNSFPVALKNDIPNDGTETVQVPDNPSASSVIKVESTEDNNRFGLSVAFVIEPAPFITVTEPSASSIWIADSEQNVAWSSGNIFGNINIKLSSDGGATFPVTLQENIQNDGIETIKVPDNPSAVSVIRVESTEDNNIFGLSAAFIIESRSTIIVSEPTSSSNWIAGSQQNVTWSSVNISGNINIKLSTDGGSTFPLTLQENIQNDGTETVQVPDSPSAASVIRVESAEDNNIFGLSGIFNIYSASSVTVTEPSVASNWISGTQQNVSWSSVNLSGNINIKLSTDGGTSFLLTLMSNIPNDGSESVQVPETESSLSVIRVESTLDNNIFGLSSVFSIGLKPSITVSEPAASASWVAGTAQNVVWSSVSVSGNINIKLSTDGGATFPVVLQENIQNDGIEPVQVPDIQSAASVIKVESVSDNNIFGLSGNFIIETKPSITVTEPAASSNWVAGTQQNVSWTSVNVQGNVNIKLSIDGGITFAVTLKSNTSNDGTEIVDVPNIESLAGVIKVESAADNSVSGTSQGSFFIIVPVIAVTSPAAGVNWPVGSRQTITWGSENITGIVNIKLSFDGGITFPVTLRSNTINDGRENITVPDNPSVTCVVKIESSVYNDFFGLSKGTFSIVHAPQITVITPSAAANWTVGSQQTVNWTSVNIAGNVNIKLSIDGGSTFPVTLKSNTQNDGTEKVEVPDNPSSNCLVKIEAAADNSIFSISEGTFTITYAPTISVTKPESGENWIIGTQQIVTWTSVNVLGNVNIKLSADGGNTFSISLGINIPNDGIETIQVPDDPSNECRIKVESTDDVNIYGINPGGFSISPVPAIQVTQPVQAANWVVGTQQTVSWSSQNINGNVNIILSIDGGNTFPVVLKSSTSNDGYEIVDVPDNPSPTSRIKIESAVDKNIFGLNPGNFTILSEPTLIVTSPLQSAEWTIGSEQTVTWNSVNITGNVNIKLSTDGGNTFPVVLKTNTSNDGSEIVDVPANPSQASRVKVESAADNNIFGINPGNFIITSEPDITVTSPLQSANWTTGSEQTVTWNSVNVTGNVNIKLSTNGGNTFPVTIKSGTGNDGSEKITVPGNQSQTCRVKVESAADSNIFGINPGDFTITSEPTITVTFPTSSVNWTVGSEQTVSWNSVNITGNVNVKLSTDGGNTFPVTLKTNTRNDGSEKVTVPDNKSELCRIKIESVSDNNIFGLNPGNFTITSEPTILVTAPLQSAKWMTGSQQSVTWNSVNVSGNVNIKLSTDAGSNFPVILKSGTANDGSESVIVPGNVSSTCRIKVESVNDNGIFGLNPGNFEITSGPSISVIQPAALVVWPAGSQQSITWNSASVSGNVNIRLSVDGGSTFSVTLKSNTANDGVELINVPSEESQTCRIKVESASDNKIFGINPGNFRITGNAVITVISPEPQTVWIIGSKRIITWTSANLNDNINIKLSTNGGSTFPVILKSGTPNDNSETIDVPNYSSINCRIRIESSTDNSIFDDCDSDFAIISYPTSVNVNSSLVFSDATDFKSYKIVGVPGSSSIPVSMSGEYKKDWQVFWDNGDDQDYLVSGNNYKFTPGKAYWIISRNPLVIKQEVETVTLNSLDNTFSIPLHRGWNLISNPFDQPVNWAAVRALNSLNENQKLYHWTGSWDSLKSSLMPYEGYYFNNSSGKDSLRIPYQPAGAFGKVSSKDEYPVKISEFLSLRLGQKGRLEKSEIYIGFDKEAEFDFDGKDYFAPPGDFQKSIVSLIRKELPERERRFFIEQRPSIGEGQEYDLEIKAVPNQLQEIEFVGTGYYNEYNIYLVDERLNNFYNIKELKKIELKLAHPVNPFKLIIGTDEYVNRIKQSRVPVSYELFRNYPNPFNPSTVIRFSLPETNTISITVYSAIGELVEVLVNEQLYNAGNYEIMFNGVNLSSGIYIVEMRTLNFRKHNKMLLIK